MTSCPTCSEDGDFFVGTPRAERMHFLSRALWQLHKARQALEPDSAVLGDELSAIISRLEEVAELSLDFDPTH